MNNQKTFEIKLERTNQNEFATFIKNAKEKSKTDKPFIDSFCFKFNNGKWDCKFPFNQEGGFCFD